MTGREVAVQQVSIARVFTLARGFDDHVPGQAQTPHRDESEQQDSPEQVTRSDCGGDGRHRDESHAPRGVDDVVAADPAADEERGGVDHDEDRQRCGRDDDEVHRRSPVDAKVHW